MTPTTPTNRDGSPAVRLIGLLGRIFRYALSVACAALGYWLAKQDQPEMCFLMFVLALLMWFRAGRPNVKGEPREERRQ